MSFGWSFHTRVVVSESDPILVFYAAVSDAMFDPTDGRARRTSCSYKWGQRPINLTVIQSMKNLKVPVSRDN